MASYVNRKGRWTAVVHIKPFPKRAKTFATKDAAAFWADGEEAVLRAARDRARSEGLPPDPEGMPRPASEIFALPRFTIDQMSGVYFLIKNDRCVYVGSSDNVHGRIKDHFKSGSKTSDFDSYTFVPCPPETMRDIEREYIKILKPLHNYTFIDREIRDARRVSQI